MQLPKSGLVLQVNNVRTVERDATSEFVVLDLVIGNNGKEKATISSLMLFSVMAEGWRWYGVSLEALPQMVALKLPQLFDGDIAPGKAAKGNMVILVPKNAMRLTLGFVGLPTLALAAEEPMIWVPLGIRGDGVMPLIKGEPQQVAKGKTYKVGDALKLTKRGVALQVNGYWERTETAGKAQLGPDEKFVFVDVTNTTLPDGKPFTQAHELRLVTSDGKQIAMKLTGESDAYLAESTRSDTTGVGRGVALFRVPKSASSYKLAVSPLDPSSQGFAFGSGNRIADEECVVDLAGGLLPPVTTIFKLPAAAATAVPTAPPAGAAASVPAELRDIPLPSGFAVVKDSAHRSPASGKFEEASATFYGKLGVQEVKDFYKKTLTEAQGFSLADEDISSDEGEGDLSYSYSKGGADYGLNLNFRPAAGGTEIEMYMNAP